MITLNEAVIIRTANDRVSQLQREANHTIATLNRLLANEKAARRADRAAFEVTLAAAAEEMDLLREIVAES